MSHTAATGCTGAQLAALLNLSEDALCVFDYGHQKLLFSNEAFRSVVADACEASKGVPDTVPELFKAVYGGEGPALMAAMKSALDADSPFSGTSPTDSRSTSHEAACSAIRHTRDGQDVLLLRLRIARREEAPRAKSPSPRANFSTGSDQTSDRHRAASSSPVRFQACEAQSRRHASVLGSSSPAASQHNTLSPYRTQSRIRRRSSLSSEQFTLADADAMLADPVVVSLLERAEDPDRWDAFSLAQATRNRPLLATTLWCLKRVGLVERFDLPREKLLAFLLESERKYVANPYHNRIHAADVVRSIHWILHVQGVSQWLEKEQQLALYIAAAAHDMEHGGVNNAFLNATNDSVAVTYLYQSPLEHMHATVLCQLLLQPHLNFLCNLSDAVAQTVLRNAMAVILTTDPTTHGIFMKRCETEVEPQWRKAVEEYNAAAKTSSQKPTASLGVLGLLLKCADIMHLAQPFEMHKHWVELLTEEFFQQGDRELSLGMKPLPFMDRRCGSDPAGSQVGFMAGYAIPLFEAASRVFPEVKAITDVVRSNQSVWSSLSAASIKPA